MKRISTTARLSISLTLITISILLAAEVFGLLPNRSSELIKTRATITESLAIQVSAMGMRDDRTLVNYLLEQFVSRNPDVLSAAFKDQFGRPIAMFGNHVSNWDDEEAADSPLTHMDVPIYRNSRLWGSVEVRFTSVWGHSWLGFLINSSIGLFIYMAVAGFLLYSLLLRRSLRELNPSRVIPERVRAAFDVLAEGVLILDDKARIVLANTSIARRLNKPPEKLVGVEIDTLPFVSKSADDGKPWTVAMREGERRNGTAMEMTNAKGETFLFTVNAAPIMDGNDRPRGALATFDDLSQVERKNQQLNKTLAQLEQTRQQISAKNRELESLAMRDPLTGCNNRRYVFERFDEIFADPAVSRGDVTCFMVDIDHFKHVNDRYGHAVGDEVIKKVGEVLMSNSRGEDIVGRYGGEEFCLISRGLQAEQQREMAERLRRAISALGNNETAPFPLMRITASIGYATGSDEHRTPMDLVNQADQALYYSKENGRNRVTRFDADTAGPVSTDVSPAQNVVYLDQAQTEHTNDIIAAGEKALDASNAEVVALRQRVKELEEVALRHADEIWHKSLYDELTNLPNRVLLLDRASQDIKRIPRYGKVVAAVSIEIETVQRLNDTVGHDAADELLIDVSERLNDLVRQSDTVGIMSSPNSSTLARIGANEFVILLADLASNEAVNHIVRRAVESLEGPMSIDDERLYINANIGISLYPHDAPSSEALIKNAGVARAQAKRQGKRLNIAYYSDEANEASSKRVRIETLLHQALRYEQFAVHYQPKVRLETGRYSGMEALLRWRSPELGNVSPAEFIPIAEEIGLMPEISSWVLTEICRQLKQWAPLGMEDFRVAVNLSPVELRDPELAERFLATLEQQDVSPALLEVEITETAVIDNMSTAVKSLQALQDAGVSLAIDDFGTGYSSLSHLTSLPLHVLKIDGCFVRDLDVSPNNQGIVNAIIAMARTAGLSVVAEGVESQAELAWLCQSGCDEIQGFYISKPVSAATVTAQLIENIEQAHPMAASETPSIWHRILKRGAA